MDETDQIFAARSEGLEGSRKIYMRRSSDGGSNFFQAVRVSDLNADAEDVRLTAESSGIVNVIWVEHTGTGERRIGFRRTEDGGATFSAPPTFLSGAGTDARCPAAGVEGNGRLYVAWLGTDGGSGETNIHIMTSLDHVSFSEPGPPLGQNQADCPHLAVRERGGAYLVWEEASEIYFAKFQPGRKNPVSSPVNVSRTSGSLSASPQIALDDAAINVVWEEEIGGKRQIYFAGSKDGGTTFSDPINLSQSSEEAISPVIRSDGNGHVVVAWAQGASGSKDIYLELGSGARGLPTPFLSGIAPIRDVNQDGIDDFIVGAPSEQSGTPGAAYLFYGGALHTTPDLVLQGFNAADRFGAAVALGDIDGDGSADVLVGAPETDNGRGTVYIYFGPDPHPNDPDVVVEGIQETGRLGVSLSTAGDINGDSVEDLIIGAPSATGRLDTSGEAYLFLGGNSLKAKSNYPVLKATDADQVYSGEDSHSQFGISVAGIGDLNGDGLGDFAVGAPYENANIGGVYLFYGGADPPTSAGKVLHGLNSGDLFGTSVAAAGDVDGNGYDDFLVGGWSRSASLFFGGDPLDTSHAIILANPETDADNGFGVTVGGTGDVNGDGFNDILVGAPFAGNGSQLYVGKVFLYLGNHLMNGTADRVFVGEQASSKLGYGAARISGDVNDDGQDDILIGASLWDDQTQTGKSNQGKTYLFVGNKDWSETGETPIIPAESANLSLSGQSNGEYLGGSLWRVQPASHP